MARAGDLGARAEQIVALRDAARSLLEPEARAEIERVERGLRAELGESIPKKRAAALLGTSVVTLDKWIDRGAIPVRYKEGSSRAEVDSETVVRLAGEARALAEAGEDVTLAAALDRLAARRTSEKQIVEAAKLSSVLTSIAGANAKR